MSRYTFAQWIDILVVYGSLVLGVLYLTTVFLVLSGV